MSLFEKMREIIGEINVVEVESGKMMLGKEFRILQQIGEKDNNENVNITCRTDEGEIIAIWGTYSEEGNERNNIKNIEKILKCGFPCTIKPSDFFKPGNRKTNPVKHDYWIPEGSDIQIIG
ncbi:MAG: hypothetical protein K8T10_14115 [Candidatus Eremiobacteraeota bacterium]|nr:hypothetical protein [Candidatus Eremiobacteraeota bacterium]